MKAKSEKTVTVTLTMSGDEAESLSQWLQQYQRGMHEDADFYDDVANFRIELNRAICD